MEEISKRGQVGQAALRSGMDRKTARMYLATGRLPSEESPPRCWRTRPDPFEEDWPAIAERLEAAPTLEGRALLEDLLKRQPERYVVDRLDEGQRSASPATAIRQPAKKVMFIAPALHADAIRPTETACRRRDVVL